MTDTTTPAAPDVTADPVWRRLVMDAQAFQRVYDTPAHLAELVQQAVVVAFTLGARFGADRPHNRPDNAQIIAMVMNYAAANSGDRHVAALHAFAHAGQRARAGQHARTETDSTTTNGGNCGG